MVIGKKHIIRTTGLLIVAATLFCVLFGQGTHLHDLGIHIGSHFDVHVHLHAHESHDEPIQGDHDHNKEDKKHRHEVRTASDIVGTLTYSYQLSPDIQSFILGMDAESETINLTLQQSPTLFNLPPPRPVPSQYHLSSFSLRGPPIA